MDTLTPEEITPSPAASPPAPAVFSPILLTLGIGLALALAAVALAFVRHELRSEIVTESLTQQEALAHTAQKISALETRLAALEALPHPDASAIDAMRSDVGTQQQTIATLTERLATLEKKPAAEPTAVASKTSSSTPLIDFIKSGAPYQTELMVWEKDHPKASESIKELKALALTGIPTDDQLRHQFQTLLAQPATAPAVASDSSLMGRINSRFGGLVTIKKQSDAPSDAASLRDIADIATIPALVQRVTHAPDPVKAPLAPWVETVRTRDAALAQLVFLENAP